MTNDNSISDAAKKIDLLFSQENNIASSGSEISKPEENPSSNLSSQDIFVDESARQIVGNNEGIQSSGEAILKKNSADEDSTDVIPAIEEKEISFYEIAEKAGISSEDFPKLKFKLDFNGEKRDISLADMENAYRGKKEFENYQEDISIEKSKFESESKLLGQRQSILEKAINEANSLISLAEDQLNNDFKQVNWENLFKTDPGRYAALKVEMAERKSKIDDATRTFLSGLQEKQKEIQDGYKSQAISRIENEKKLLFKKLPHWTDDAKRISEQKEIRTFLNSNGFSEGELNSIQDHRLLVMARKAMLYDKGQQVRSTISAKPSAIPKAMRGGRAVTDNEAKLQQKAQLFGRLQKTGKLSDAASFIDKILSGN